MTKKNYVEFARIVRESIIVEHPHYANSYKLLKGLTEYFEADNSHFDKQKFLKACGGLLDK